MIRLGIIGQSGKVDAQLGQLAEDVGKEIAAKGAILLSGGTDGIMERASKGAQEGGSIVVGILPGDTLDMGNPYIDIPINTGLSFDYRSLILVHSSDAIIVIAGGNGTLGELSAAYLNNKPIVVMEPSGGLAARIRPFAFEGMFLDERRTVKIDYASTPKEAVELALKRANR